MHVRGLGRMTAAVLLAASIWSCSEDCEDEIAAGARFLTANQACETDTDCVVVSTGCHTFEGGICSQAHLNRTAANSAEWASIQADLEDCESGCAVCAAALVPAQCVDQRCTKP